jgi:VanZ family protein
LAARSWSFLGVFVRYWLPVLAYVTLIFALSSVSNLAPPVDWKNADKLAHLGEYTILGFLLGRAYWGSRLFPTLLATSLLAIVTGFATGIADELLQASVPGRVSSALDFAMDAVGIVVGQLLYALVARRHD